MVDKDFTDTKAGAEHSALTNTVFKLRGTLFSLFGLLALVALYFEARGTILPAATQAVLTGVGATLLVCGLVIRLWAALYIVHNRNRHLVSSGPYSIVRNPLYVGNFVAIFGALVAAGSFLAILIGMLGMAFVYYFTIRYEDARLAIHFEDEFNEFRARVPRVIPSLRNIKALFTQERKDSISYNNIQKELFRALQALGVVALILVFTYAVRYGLI
ncbi:MAG: isoprenylcysteine carboxylmethyltransferase family protein [Halioglobus sp.]|nr:isoprenylcysteine carboxylmethyltransferase family protein [Halioglobus sp.]